MIRLLRNVSAVEKGRTPKVKVVVYMWDFEGSLVLNLEAPCSIAFEKGERTGSKISIGPIDQGRSVSGTRRAFFE